MSWILLVAAGVMEAVWAAALAASHGFTRRVPTPVFGAALALSMAGLGRALRGLPTGTADARCVPTLVFGTGLVLSMAGLALAMRELPTGTAYAVWVGIGATLTVIWGFVTHQERPTLLRVSLLVLLVGSVVGLKVVS